ncbi:hypothetical protein [Longimicrobium sp.]|uniref:hypothetical protein n=1 Tax=Longimicrobium sp. TaxID=2029185 RepID=UPI003B3B2BAC
MEHLATWAATGLAAKILADVLRRAYGFDRPGRIASATRSIETDFAYALAFGAAMLVVRQIGLDAALLVAIVLRSSAIISERVLLPGNHTFLELYLAVVCLQLHETPVALAAVLQVMAVSMWAYAAYQKAYQREYLNGTYFYLTMRSEGWRLGTWTSPIRQAPKIEGDYGPIDPAAQSVYRWMAVMVLVGETVPPILAFAVNGTIWSVLLLLTVALPVGLSSKETNFMITNLLVAAAFLVPFEGQAFLGALNDPVVAVVVVGLCLVWPPVHAALARHLRVSPWKLAGWGMYSTHKPRINVVVPGGELRPLRGSIPGRIMIEFGACRIAWVRDAIRRYYFRWDWTEPATGMVFRWYRFDGGRYVTHCVVYENTPGAPVQTFDITDEAGTQAFHRHLRSLTLEPELALVPRGAVAVAAAG